MDSIINFALEEICLQFEQGIALTALFPKLEPSLTSSYLDLSPGVKHAIWTNLLAIPSLRFEARGKSYTPSDASIQPFEDAEKLNLKIIAQESLRDSFLGIHNSNLSANQRRALERIAIARTNGVLQHKLCKDLGIEGRNMHYVLRHLECQNLIVRQSAIEKKKETCTEGESKSLPCSATNLIYLFRYAKQLGSQQIYEITKEQTVGSLGDTSDQTSNGDDSSQNGIKVDVLVKDYAPIMKVICDKLEKANGKVLVVPDIKKDLGYRGTSGHRAWRNILRRLIGAQMVEQFNAKVNEKTETCLRLLKPVSLGSCSEDQVLKFGKNSQTNDQFVELPIEHQIYDMVDAAGSDGLTITEISERLGIDHKKNHSRLVYMFFRFGMKVQAEQREKVILYRVWTFRNFNLEPTTVCTNQQQENDDSDLHVPRKLVHFISGCHASTADGNFDDPGQMKDLKSRMEPSCGSPMDIDSNDLVPSTRDAPESILDPKHSIVVSEHNKTCSTAETAMVTLETPPPADLTPHSRRSNQRHPSRFQTVDGARREKRILERLKDEKFILKAEIPRWLSSFETDKRTTIDRKTVDRILNKLQEQGHCKCIEVSAPVLTNCQNRRTSQVVLHPSVQNLPPELLAEIQDRLRSFEMQNRQHSSGQKNHGAIPVLKDIQRIETHTDWDNEKVSRAETMRTNGYILARMARAKLLHIFLWDYVHGLASLRDALPSKNCVYEFSSAQSSSKLFSIGAAINAIPVELFLQVVGSTQKYDIMLEKCKMGLLVADLPQEEYKQLMDTCATTRLSLVVDILRRLKLVRMVTDIGPKDGVEVTHATSLHVLELKPYIEEPVSKDKSSLTFQSFDLRPRVRHDFTLSKREAVEEYWQTLEYCYSAADRNAAMYAFPGSAVHEVFSSRSWASVRIMTAEQRAELLNCLGKDNQSKKLSYKECEKLANDLKLSLEQVLRVYYGVRQKRRNKFQDKNENNPLQSKRGSSCESKNSPEARPTKLAKIDSGTGQLDDIVCTTANQTMEEQNGFVTFSEEHDIHFKASQENDHIESNDPGMNKDEHHPIINQCVFSKRKQKRHRRFLWTDENDRQLVVQYIRNRVVCGAKYPHTDWASLSDLPSSPNPCKRRMAFLNRNIKFRKSVLRLCNLLSERYVQHLEKTQNLSLNKDNCSLHSPSNRGTQKYLTQDTGLEGAWDDFENEEVKAAFDDVLLCKKLVKLEASKTVGSLREEYSDINRNTEKCDFQEHDSVPSPGEFAQSHARRKRRASAQRLHHNNLDKKLISLLNNGVNINRQVYESLAVSNVVELFKLVFLSSSRASEMPNLLEEILRRYSEHDLFVAFSYLREKKILVGGDGKEHFELSQQFLHSISKSPFPSNTGKRASKFSCWLDKVDKELMEGGCNLAEDLVCGDVFHLFALVSFGEISISPLLPENGIGEAEELRSLKRKADDESLDGDRAKINKSSSDGEIISRREKGFPGIVISVQRVTIARAESVDFFRNMGNCDSDRNFHSIMKLNTTLDQISGSLHSDHTEELFDSCDTINIEANFSVSPFEAMTIYAQQLTLAYTNLERANVICPKVFSTVCAAIQKAGDQGLSMKEISQVINMPGEKTAALIVDVLQAFRRALKVNAYDSVRIVDNMYCQKYFLALTADFNHGLPPPSLTKLMERSENSLSVSHTAECDSGSASPRGKKNTSIDGVHKVTILNCPEENIGHIVQVHHTKECCMQGKAVPHKDDQGFEKLNMSSVELCKPILPWMNGDGTINNIVYKGLRRRVLGIVMQNPGILEDNIIRQMDMLNPQSCRTLLELMVLDKHLTVRKMYQTKSSAPPALLLKSTVGRSEMTFCEHFFANPLSTSLL